METTKKINHLKILRNTQVSPSLRIPQGVQVLLIGLFGKSRISIRSPRLSHLSAPALALALVLLDSAFFSDSAYAAFSASISRASSEAVALSDDSGSGTIKPSYAGTLGTGSDVVTVSSNCSAGYNLYVSATKDGSTSLTTDGGKDYIPSTTTATGSEAALSKDTWGVGKNGTTFSKIPAYTADASSLAPLYTGTGDASSTATDYTVYYGANVSTAKTPGTYTGDILYTVVMNDACVKYALKFNGNGATTNNLTTQSIVFDSTINLADISSTDKIARTGYTLTGWKDQNNNEYGITGTADVNPNDLSSVTLTAQWKINSRTVSITRGSNVSTVTATDGTTTKTNDTLTAEYNKTITVSATAFSTGYHFSGWTVNSGGVTLYSNSSMTTASTTSTPAYFRMPDQNVTLTANAAPNTFSITYSANGGTGAASKTSETATYGTNVTMPTKNTLAKSGYDFLGWSLSSTATSATWAAGKTDVAPTAVKSNVTTVDGGSVTVYAVWKASIAAMQSTSCSSLTVNTITTLRDSRDDQTYTVYRWPNTGTAGTNYPTNMSGYCIMTKDLALGYITGGSVTKGGNLILTASNSAAAATITARTGADDWSTTNSNTNYQYINGTGGTYGSHSYYTWGAAQKVCPRGWRLPTHAEYSSITSFLWSSSGSISAASSKIRSTPYNFIYGGSFYPPGWSNFGSAGEYWSSTQESDTHGYHLYFDSSKFFSPDFGGLKYDALSVRCIAAP